MQTELGNNVLNITMPGLVEAPLISILINE